MARIADRTGLGRESLYKALPHLPRTDGLVRSMLQQSAVALMRLVPAPELSG